MFRQFYVGDSSYRRKLFQTRYILSRIAAIRAHLLVSYLYGSSCVNARFGDARLIHNRLPACYPNAPILEKGNENDIGSLLVKQFDHDYAGWL